MRYVQILLAVCVILNLYHARYTVLQITEACLELFIWCLTDIHHFLQHIVASKVNAVCTRTNSDCNRTYNLSDYGRGCPTHRYIIRVIERRPLIIYIEQILTSDEIQHLITLTYPRFESSSVLGQNDSRQFDIDFRSSSTAYVGRSETPVVKCLEQRFAQFQGDIDPSRIEPLQVVRYEYKQFFKPHYDWFHSAAQKANGGQRLTTFFTYLYANGTDGETEFLNVKFNHTLHSPFCDILICDERTEEHGLRFRPIPGNGIFWYNVNEDGRDDELTLHAGRSPGENGRKIGLNTWTREQSWKVDTHTDLKHEP